MPHSTAAPITGKLLAFALLAGLSCGATGITPEPPPPPPAPPPPVPISLRILFVGNSLTYYNDLPATVGAIATSAGDALAISNAVGANLALIDHLNGGSNVVQLMRDSSWDYVVLQQGPTPSGICRDSLQLWTRMFDTTIRAAHGKAALFMTWPATTNTASWDDVRLSFQLAAQGVGGVFLPAGEAWRILLAEHPDMEIYGKDGYHPSPMGSFLAALEIYERLSGRDARTLPALAFQAGRPMQMSADTIRMLQQAAHSANATFPAFGNVPTPTVNTDYRPPGSTTC